MANNVNVTEGVGKTVSTEDIGGAQVQRIKVMGGETGSSSMMSVNPDGSIKVSVIGALSAAISGGSVIAIPTGNQSVSGAVTAPPGSVLQVRTDGTSVIAVQGGTRITSVISATPSSMLVGASIFGQLPAGTATIGAVTAPAGSIATVVFPAGSVTQVSATIVAGSVMSVTNPAGSVTGVRTDNASVIAIVQNSSFFAVQAGTNITSIVSTVPSSVIVGASIFGQLPAGTATIGAVTAPAGSIATVVNPAGSVTAVSATFVAGSVATIVHPAGSVTAVRTDNASVITTQIAGSIMATSAIQFAGSVLAVRTDNASVITKLQDSSILAVPVGSTIAVLQAASIVGTYAEDAAHTSGDKGVFALQVRNDTMASITSADGDYSPQAVGPVGEVLTANAPITKWISGTADLRTVQGTSVQVLAAGATSVFTYVTGVQVANMGPSSVLVTIAGGLGSILAYTIAPAGGGSNIIYPNPLRTGEASKVTASLSGTASVLVSAQGFSAKI